MEHENRVLECGEGTTREQAVQLLAAKCGGVQRLGYDSRSAVDRALRRHESAVFDVQGALYIINSPVPLPEVLRGASGIFERKSQPGSGALRLIIDATKDWTELDWRSDPHLRDLVGRLAKNGVPELELVHAAASLLSAGKLTPKTNRLRADARTALSAVAELGFSPARLRFSPGGILHSIYTNVGAVLGPCPAPLVLGRGDELATIGIPFDRPPDWCLPAPASSGTFEGDWYESLEQQRGRRFAPGQRPYSTKPYPPIDWEALDNHLAFALLALRRGLRRGQMMTMAEGRLLVEAGAGMFASVRAWQWTSARQVTEFSLVAAPRPRSNYQDTRFLMTQEHRGLEVPRGLALEAAGYLVEVAFVASGLHAGCDLADTAKGSGAARDRTEDIDDDDDEEDRRAGYPSTADDDDDEEDRRAGYPSTTGNPSGGGRTNGPRR